MSVPRCPKCKSDNIECMDIIESSDGSAIYGYHCYNCHKDIETKKEL